MYIMKMIPYNVHYEIGASLLMILLLCCIVGKKRLRTRSNNLFLCNVCLLIAGNLIDGLCGLINSGMITCSVHTQRLCNALDGSIFYLLIAAYVLYFLSLAYLTNYHNKQIFSMSILYFHFYRVILGAMESMFFMGFRFPVLPKESR